MRGFSSSLPSFLSPSPFPSLSLSRSLSLYFFLLRFSYFLLFPVFRASDMSPDDLRKIHTSLAALATEKAKALKVPLGSVNCSSSFLLCCLFFLGG